LSFTTSHTRVARGVKQPDAPPPPPLPTYEFPPPKTANTFQAGCRAVALSNASVSFHRPKRPVHAVCLRPAEWLEACCPRSLVRPPGFRRQQWENEGRRMLR